MSFIKPATLREQVQAYLREAIEQGRLRPGERLREQALCDQLRISRPTLREALRALEAERLVVIEPHRGPSVARMSLKEAQDLYALRALLEGYAAQMFARLATQEEIAQLREAVEELDRCANAGDREGLLIAKQHFYDTLLTGCGNHLVAEILPSMHSRINLLRATSFSMTDRATHSVREIRELLDFIVKRDEQGACAAAQHHIECARQAALQVLTESESEAGLEEKS
ncbi:GntR family transcriptional regulator [Orrella sp. 11846]|uniref:GntR family transcriptional regulator n=1 Tax=Orrella sp. 11846 TaxID=3409913 RepID=UPI003B59C5A2